jgi:hypothetical protein
MAAQGDRIWVGRRTTSAGQARPGGVSPAEGATLGDAGLWRRPSGELVDDDRDMATLNPDRRATPNGLRSCMPALTGGADPRDEDVAPPPEQADDERNGQGDGSNDQGRVRIFSRSEDSEPGKSLDDMAVLEVLLDDEQHRGRPGQPYPEPSKPPNEAARSRTKVALARAEGTRDDSEAVQPPRPETEQAECGGEDDGDRGAPCPVVTAVGESLVVAGAVGKEEDEVVGDDERDEGHREETEETPPYRHDGDYTARPGLRPLRGPFCSSGRPPPIRCKQAVPIAGDGIAEDRRDVGSSTEFAAPRRPRSHDWSRANRGDAGATMAWSHPSDPTELLAMPLSDVRRPWQGGLASIVAGLGRDVAPLNHLGPHNALEWALYLVLFALLVAVGVHVVRSGDDALPRVRKPHHDKTRRDQDAKSAGGSPAPQSDEWFDDHDAGS